MTMGKRIVLLLFLLLPWFVLASPPFADASAQTGISPGEPLAFVDHGGHVAYARSDMQPDGGWLQGVERWGLPEWLVGALVSAGVLVILFLAGTFILGARRRARSEGLNGEIAGQDEAGETLARSEAEYRSLIERTRAGVATTDTRGRFTYVNQALCEMVGYPAEELIGEPFARFLHPDDKKRMLKLFQNIFTSPVEEPRLEFRAIHKEGHTVHLYASPIILWHEGRIAGFNVIVQDLTERRLAEEAQRESEERYRLLFETSPGAIVLLGLDGTIIDHNEAAGKLTETTREEVIGRPFAELGVVPEGKLTRYMALFMRILRGKEVEPLEVEIVNRAGEPRWLEVRPSLLKRGGVPWAIQVLGRDITAYKRAEGALREAESEKQTILDSLAEHVVHPDRDMKILWLNRAACESVGKTRDEMIGRHCYEFWGERGDPCPDCPVMVAMETGQPQGWEKQTPDGRVWFVRGTPVWDDEGNVVGGVEVTLEITERVQAQEAEQEQRVLAGALSDIAAVINSTLDLDEVLERILDSAERVVPHDTANVMLVEPGTRIARIARHRGYEGRRVDAWLRNHRFEIDAIPLQRRMFETRRPHIVSDTQSAGEWVTFPQTAWVRSHVGAPICVEDTVIGFIHLDSATPDAFDPSDTDRLQAFADQAAIAIWNARLYESERRQLRLARTLQAVGALLTTQMSLDDVLESIFDLLAEVVDYDSVSVQLVDDERRLSFISGRSLPDLERAREIANTVARHVIEERLADRHVVVIPDTEADERWVRLPGSEHIRSWIGAALRVKGRLIGTLNVDSTTPDAYDESVGQMAASFANQAAIAIENARLYGESEERNRQLALLNRITRIGTVMLDVDDLLKSLADMAAEIIGGDACYIGLWNMDLDAPIPAAASGALHTPYRRLQIRPDEVCLIDIVLTQGAMLDVEDVENTPYLSPRLRKKYGQEFGARSMLALPLQVSGLKLGALLIAFSRPHRFTDDDITWAGQAAEVIALAIARAQVYQELEKRVEERTSELRLANERLLELTRLKDEFVANVSHELRTPITGLKLYNHLLSLRPERTPVYLERLKREVGRLEHTIEDLLVLSRMDQDRLPTKLEAVNLNEMARLHVTDRALLAEERALSLTFIGQSSLPIIKADPALLEQALSTLVTNALNYTPEGGAIEIRTLERCFEGRHWVGVSISDTGPGISPEERPRLFERFFRGQVGIKSGRAGTGLGLAIAREIVERHEGQIEVISPRSDGAGTTFTIWLPLEG